MQSCLWQPHHIQNFASQSGLRPPHHGQSILLRKTVCDHPVFFGVHTLRFTGQSILLCKMVYCQNFATQNCLFRTLLCKVASPPHHSQSILLRKTVFDRPVFFGVHTLRFIARSKFSELYLILKLYEFELNNNLKNIRKAHVITHELFLYFKLWLCLCF